jgi:hypothetical protein
MPQGTPGLDGVTQEVIFRNDTGTMTVTLSRFPASHLPAAPGPSHRLIRVLEGAISLSGTATPPDRLGAGDHVFLPKSSACAWDIAAGTVAVIVDVTA